MRLDRTYLVVLLLAPGAVAAQQSALANRARAALSIPLQVDTLRRNGVPEDQVRVVVDEAQRRKLPGTETHDLLGEANKDVREHGPVNNFGAFVQAQLASGKRGRALAAAIRAEHQRRGMGKGKMVTAGGASASNGRSDSARRRATSAQPNRGSSKTAPNANARSRANAGKAPATTPHPPKSAPSAANRSKAPAARPQTPPKSNASKSNAPKSNAPKPAATKSNATKSNAAKGATKKPAGRDSTRGRP